MTLFAERTAMAVEVEDVSEVGYYDEGILSLDSALAAGGTRRTLARVVVNCAGNCEKPIGFEHQWQRRAKDDRGPERRSYATMILTGDGRCRRCEPCLRFRRFVWTLRALAEVDQSSRTWFGTLTLAPGERTKILAEARLRCHRSGVDYDAQTEREQFGDLCRQLGERLTRYLKRVRKESGAQIRYIFVVERHESGDPHLHALLHECSAVPVRKETLVKQWPHGFSAWKLADKGASFYVCKYLAKDAQVRIRASQRYGSDRGGIPPEIDRNVRRSLRGPSSQARLAGPVPAAVEPTVLSGTKNDPPAAAAGGGRRLDS